MSHPPQPQRPARKWYCNDRLTDDYKEVHRHGGDLKMLKGLKILRAIVVNAGLIAVTLFSIFKGADPTVVGSLGVLSLGLYNGIEIADYISLIQAVREVQAGEEQTDTTDDSGDS
jgi:hypothetical protein